MQRSLSVSYFKATLAMSFWALTFVWIKIALKWYHPIEIVFLRLVLASGLLFLTMLLTRHRELPERKDVLWFMLVAFCEPFCYFMGEAFGMQYVSSTLGSLIISLIPIITALGAWIILKEKVSVLLFFGLLISFAGVAILAIGSGEFYATLKGILLMLLAVLSGMFFGITVRKLSLKYDTLTIISWQSVFGMLYFLPFFIVMDGRHFFSMQHNGTGLITIAGMSVFASVGAFMLFIGVIRDIGVIRSNLFANLIPVITAFLAFFILGDQPTVRSVIGIALVIIGLILSQYEDIKKLAAKSN
jgi:drug/metabolite transporter (DMT)-like permease